MKKACLLLTLFFLLTTFGYSQKLKYRDLSSDWDTVTVLKNPHKGWYIHYYDNGLKRYGASLKPGDFLQDFPGLNHIYLRLAWNYLEPQEGKFNWQVVDSLIEKWTKKGYKITFRITTKETGPDQVFATPEWVKKAGAKGEFYGDGKNWEPEYDDPIFLEKLEKFHRAFAQRYDGKPYVEYIDIGSYGDWGEGHTVFGSKRKYPFSMLKKHVDIYKMCYKKSLLMISDDVITAGQVEESAKEEIILYLIANNITIRDDSVSVKYFADRYGLSTLRSGYLFEKIWRKLPVDLELEHYQATLDQDTWRKGIPFEAAIHEAHATYIGFHGEPRKWLSENPEFARKMANKVGYWYFIKGVDLPEKAKAGRKISFNIHWENRGVAPAYNRYEVFLTLKGKKIKAVEQLKAADNRKWMPDSIKIENYSVVLPANIPAGSLTLSVKLMGDKNRNVLLGMKSKTNDGTYVIGEIDIL